jgi:DNA polymerase-3 subunit alpha
MKNYIPLHVHSHYSLLDGLSKPEDIAKRCNKLSIPSCAITDHGSISGCIQFFKTMKANKIKPILGVELYISDQDASIKDKSNQKLSHMVVLAKNLNGWKQLIKIVSASNNHDLFYYKPRLDLNRLGNLINSQDLICICGHPGSYLANKIYDGNAFVSDNEIDKHVGILYDIFGKENTFIEIQLMDTENSYQQNIGLKLRDYCNKNKIAKMASIDAHYCESEDSIDQRILLCSNLKMTLPQVSSKIINNENFSLESFFKSEKYHILSSEEINSINTDDEIVNTQLIDSMCEEYDILHKPTLPEFNCPNGLNAEQYLRNLCRDGWREKIQNRIPKEEQDKYADRIKYELDVLEKANLSSYFLIIQDIVNHVRHNNWLPGPGRGSAAGCLVSYLVGITSIDPIKYNLIFERFYNAGRNTKDRISMPDIDVDVPINHRENIIDYIKNTYGENRVSQMITYNTLKGRGALKEVLRVYDNISFEEMNQITKNIPDEAKIADELQEMKDEDGESSIIKWALENNGAKLKDWCYIKNDNLEGPLAKRFEQAIRLEGTKYNQSKHAAGIAIAQTSLESLCPMVYDTKTEQNIAGLEMNDLEALGIVKFDILGIALLDKIMSIKSYLNKGENNDNVL